MNIEITIAEGIQAIKVAYNAHGGEYGVKQYYDHNVFAFDPAYHALYARGKRSGGIEDFYAAGNQQHGGNYARTVHKALMDGCKKAEYADG